ncbi:gfo/Idh/MocA family oxidoreductase [Halobacteriales archaeon QS_5_68_33]|nr:MAG: gfo/Idh/MocA family oxidoreductase [Halobacteriales archaeon QS_5_68_33]
MENSLTVGIVGLEPSGTYYADIFTDLGHRVMLADSDPDQRESFEDEFETKTFENPDELFRSDIDVVFVSTPNKYHGTVATEAMETGYDVLLEKPLAATMEDAERIVETAERTGNICMVAYFHRFREYCDILKSYIDRGELGEIVHIDAKFIRRRGVPGRGTWYTSKKLAGGGALIDVGCHVVDLVLYLLEWPNAEDIVADSRSDFGHRTDYRYLEMWGEDDEAKMYDVEDSVRTFLKFDTGTTTDIEVAWAANVQYEHSYRIQGTDGGAELRLDNNPISDKSTSSLNLYEVRSGGADHFADSEIISGSDQGYEECYEGTVKAFVDAVRTGDRPEKCNVREALATQELIDWIYRADKTGE